jgi:hypothetical protein
MITFQEFLAESRSAPLYHATTAKHALTIWDTNIMRRGKRPENGINIRTVSLTRSLPFAASWLDIMGGAGIIFQLDQQKLNQRYRIKPYNYFGFPDSYNYITRIIPNERSSIAKSKGNDVAFDNQHEEIVIEDIKDFRSYVTKIYFMGNDIATFEDFKRKFSPAKVELLK